MMPHIASPRFRRQLFVVGVDHLTLFYAASVWEKIRVNKTYRLVAIRVYIPNSGEAACLATGMLPRDPLTCKACDARKEGNIQ